MQHDVSHAFVDLQAQRRLRYPFENALEASDSRFRFSLKSLFVVVTVCAIWFGILQALGATLFGGVAYSAGFVPVALLSWFFFRSLPKRAPRMRIGSWPSMVVSTLLAGGLFGALCFIQSTNDGENAFIGPLFGMFFGWLFSTAGLIYAAPVLIILDAISRGRCLASLDVRNSWSLHRFRFRRRHLDHLTLRVARFNICHFCRVAWRDT